MRSFALALAGEPGTARRRQVLAGTVLLAGALLPADRIDEGPVLCVFRATAGVPCPGCGLTRSVVKTVHGDVVQGFAEHPAGPALVALLAAWLVLGARHRATPLDPARWFAGPGARALSSSVVLLWLSWAVVRASTVPG